MTNAQLIPSLLFAVAIAKSPEMGVCAIAVSLVVVPIVSVLKKQRYGKGRRTLFIT